MHPMSPVVPSADGDEVVYAKDQPQYQPLPCLKAPDGTILTRWSVSEQEAKEIASQGYVYLTVQTFNGPLPPLMMTTYVPEDLVELRPLAEWPEEIDA